MLRCGVPSFACLAWLCRVRPAASGVPGSVIRTAGMTANGRPLPSMPVPSRKARRGLTGFHGRRRDTAGTAWRELPGGNCRAGIAGGVRIFAVHCGRRFRKGRRPNGGNDAVGAGAAALLNDPALSADRRADVALRLLDMATAGAQGRAREAAVATPGLMPASCFAIPDFLSPTLHAAAVQTAL